MLLFLSVSVIQCVGCYNFTILKQQILSGEFGKQMSKQFNVEIGSLKPDVYFCSVRNYFFFSFSTRHPVTLKQLLNTRLIEAAK